MKLLVTALIGMGGAWLTQSLFGAAVPAGETNKLDPIQPRVSQLTAATAQPTNAPIVEIAPGVFTIGLVTLDKNRETIFFPAVVNMREGAIEYTLVHNSGKTHESVFRTEALPFHLHLASLLLGWRNADSIRAAGETAPKAPVDPSLLGQSIAISVAFKVDGAERIYPMEEFVRNTTNHQTLSHGAWVYNGSHRENGKFVAQPDGSIVAIMTDEDSLINNPRPGREDDKIWEPIGDLLPPLGTAVKITLSAAPRPPSSLP